MSVLGAKMRGICSTERPLGAFDRMRWRVRSQPSPVGFCLLYLNKNYNNNSYSFHCLHVVSSVLCTVHINMILRNPPSTRGRHHFSSSLYSEERRTGPQRGRGQGMNCLISAHSPRCHVDCSSQSWRVREKPASFLFHQLQREPGL